MIYFGCISDKSIARIIVTSPKRQAALLLQIITNQVVMKTACQSKKLRLAEVTEIGRTRAVFGDGGVSVLDRWHYENCIRFKSPLTIPSEPS